MASWLHLSLIIGIGLVTSSHGHVGGDEGLLRSLDDPGLLDDLGFANLDAKTLEELNKIPGFPGLTALKNDLRGIVSSGDLKSLIPSTHNEVSPSAPLDNPIANGLGSQGFSSPFTQPFEETIVPLHDGIGAPGYIPYGLQSGLGQVEAGQYPVQGVQGYPNSVYGLPQYSSAAIQPQLSSFQYEQAGLPYGQPIASPGGYSDSSSVNYERRLRRLSGRQQRALVRLGRINQQLVVTNANVLQGLGGGYSAGYPAGISAGYPAGIGAGYPAGVGAGYPAGIGAGYPAGINAGYPSDIQLGNSYPGSVGGSIGAQSVHGQGGYAVDNGLPVDGVGFQLPGHVSGLSNGGLYPSEFNSLGPIAEGSLGPFEQPLTGLEGSVSEDIEDLENADSLLEAHLNKIEENLDEVGQQQNLVDSPVTVESAIPQASAELPLETPDEDVTLNTADEPISPESSKRSPGLLRSFLKERLAAGKAGKTGRRQRSNRKSRRNI